ncbi:cysteine--tRNA ligase [Marinilabiliaceae bacterium ANBcel2]|nr:cysteine--tRNA ligase [Marinilabiliaceae bacterium ANBcel2]
MSSKLKIFNTLSKAKETFKPINAQHVGLYVCGPTVYGDPHLGHARPAITFDLLFRYLKHQNYKVRYVRNITDVGHLESDADEGEDKIGKKARLEKLEPMEVVQYYTNRYHKYMDMLNVEPPSIEPQASGHIIEQLETVEKIIKNGYAYIKNGSVYFDVERYNKKHQYGILSGRVLEDLYSTTRELEGQKEKRNSCDFALWKKADTSHIMKWPSKYSAGYPGWHLECSAMSAKYLGKEFDIHGGGMDLMFPHHECEIAQSTIAHGKNPARYWMHNNMITINGRKMGKSLGNFITLEQFFKGEHQLLSQPFSPMTIRFFILQAHYRSTLDFSNEALLAAEKGVARLTQGVSLAEKIEPGASTSFNVEEFETECYNAINDDLNSPILIARLFEGVKAVNSALARNISFTEKDLTRFKNILKLFTFDILGLSSPNKSGDKEQKTIEELMSLIIDIRQKAKKSKDWDTADKIRDKLKNAGVKIKDGKEGTTWEL